MTTSSETFLVKNLVGRGLRQANDSSLISFQILAAHSCITILPPMFRWLWGYVEGTDNFSTLVYFETGGCHTVKPDISCIRWGHSRLQIHHGEHYSQPRSSNKSCTLPGDTTASDFKYNNLTIPPVQTASSSLFSTLGGPYFV